MALATLPSKKQKFVTKKVITRIPERVEIEEQEVDTLQEFLDEFKITEDQLRAAAKSYVDEKVAQPTADLSDLEARIAKGVADAEKYERSEKNVFVLKDSFVVDYLTKSGWSCSKTAEGYRVQRGE
jgi:hypothetical protein